jgi:hypothetical protein
MSRNFPLQIIAATDDPDSKVCSPWLSEQLKPFCAIRMRDILTPFRCISLLLSFKSPCSFRYIPFKSMTSNMTNFLSSLNFSLFLFYSYQNIDLQRPKFPSLCSLGLTNRKISYDPNFYILQLNPVHNCLFLLT